MFFRQLLRLALWSSSWSLLAIQGDPVLTSFSRACELDGELLFQGLDGPAYLTAMVSQSPPFF